MQKNELPWVTPRKGFSFNLDGLKDLLNGSVVLLPFELRSSGSVFVFLVSMSLFLSSCGDLLMELLFSSWNWGLVWLAGHF